MFQAHDLTVLHWLMTLNQKEFDTTSPSTT